jgi:hypothetical protein
MFAPRTASPATPPQYFVMRLPSTLCVVVISMAGSSLLAPRGRWVGGAGLWPDKALDATAIAWSTSYVLARAQRPIPSALERDPAQAVEQAVEILKVVPDHPAAILLLGVAQRRTGNATLALQTLEALTQKHPQWALAHYERAFAFAQAGKGDAAIAEFRRAVALVRARPRTLTNR